VTLHGQKLILGDNMSVVFNSTVPSSVLKNKHNAISYHKVKKAIAARIMRFHWNSVSIPSDRVVIEVHDYS
jgi:hypothetical protein